MSRGRPKKPIALHLAEGNPSHLTEAEIEERQATELNVPFTNVKPPSYLDKQQKKKFKDIASKLIALGIMTELDVDCLAMYVTSFDLYLSCTGTLAECVKSGDIDGAKDVQAMQDKMFRQAHTAAKALGLTITDRCKIVVPQPPETDDEL